MNTEAVLAQILPGIESIIKAVVEGLADAAEPPTLYELEKQVQAVLPAIGQIMVQALVTGQGSGAVGPSRGCSCGGEQRYHDRARRLRVQTSLGEVQVAARAYYRCRQCGACSYPLDEQLGLKEAGRMSRYLQEQVAWLYSLLSAHLVQQTLGRFGWPALCVSQIREHAQALGAELEQREQAHLQTARQEALRPPAQQRAPRQPVAGGRVYTAPDGVMYCTPTRDPQTGAMQWRELKVAAVYAVAPSPAEPPARPRTPVQAPTVRERIGRWMRQHHPDLVVPPADHATQVSYVVETGPWQDFGMRLWAELWERGVGRPASDLAVVADGSEHIDQVVDREFRVPGVQVTRILDLPHAQEHLWTVSKAVFGEGNAAGVAWTQRPLRALERGAVLQVVAALDALASGQEATAPPAAALARKTAAYFAQRAAQVAYPRFVAQGYQIGSGLAESACKRFGTERMKGAGMRWTVPGAQRVATSRMLLLSGRWEEVSAYCRQAA
jgi:hypothetical protein